MVATPPRAAALVVAHEAADIVAATREQTRNNLKLTQHRDATDAPLSRLHLTGFRVDVRHTGCRAERAERVVAGDHGDVCCFPACARITRGHAVILSDIGSITIV
jgi:hypothetical protein